MPFAKGLDKKSATSSDDVDNTG